jgi:hypothetical protein
MKNLFSENRLVFFGLEGGPEAAPKSAEVKKNALIKLTKKVLNTSENPDNTELKSAAKKFMKKHENNPVGRTEEIKSAVKKSTDPKLNDNQVDKATDKIDRAIQRLAYTRLG